MKPGLRAYLELVRPANVITAFADVLAGSAAAGAFAGLLATSGGRDASSGLVPTEPAADLFWLLVSTAGLYAGGVVLNDVFDAEIDASERPERPIPSGRVTRVRAASLGALLLIGGVLAASLVGTASLVAAALVGCGAVIYDAYGKHHAVLGPINMGLCRGGNLLLGISIVPAVLSELWFLAAIPIAYIGAVTAVSTGEVYGGTRMTGVLAILLVGVVVAALLLLGIRLDYGVADALPFAGLLTALVIPAYFRAAVQPTPDRIRTAVKYGVLSLVVMDAALAAGFAGWPVGVIVLLLLPLSYLLGRAFAVT